jgi:tetratricopeptide (TPR) repeat protein
MRPAAQPAAGLAMPIAVAALDNQTGDSSLTTWGRLAGDWVTQGLQETGLVTVVPWPSALRAWERFEAGRTGGSAVDPLSVMRAETGAGTVVTGAYYLVGDRLRFQTEVSDAATGRLLGAPPPVTVAADAPHTAVKPLRDRVMGAIAVHTDQRLSNLPGLMERPPTYEAYRAFDRGLRLYLDQEYGSAADAFRDAYVLDTTFVVPLYYAALGFWNNGEIRAADSLLGALRARRATLSEYHDLMLQYMEASLVSDGQAALRAIRRATEVAPDTRAGYNLALTALDANRPREALAALERLNPDRGTLRGWSSYWTQLTHALHMLGQHERELAAAWEMQDRFPDRRVADVLEARALGALGRTDAIDSLLRSISALPSNTYWSQAAAMIVAGEELAAHGRPEAARPLWDRAISWLANQLARDPSSRPHRYWMGTAWYDAGHPDNAAPYFVSLADDFPDDQEFRGLAALVLARAGESAAARRRLGPPLAHDRGRHTAFRARLAAIAGDHELAVSLLSEALRQGVGSFPWLHASANHELSLLADDPTYRRLIAGDAGR